MIVTFSPTFQAMVYITGFPNAKAEVLQYLYEVPVGGANIRLPLQHIMHVSHKAEVLVLLFNKVWDRHVKHKHHFTDT